MLHYLESRFKIDMGSLLFPFSSFFRLTFLCQCGISAVVTLDTHAQTRNMKDVINRMLYSVNLVI